MTHDSNSLHKRRVIGMESCWKFSIARSTRAIAFLDLIDAMIFTVYRGISLIMLLSKIPTNNADRELSGTALRTSLVSSNGMIINHSHIGSFQLDTGKGIFGDDGHGSHSIRATYMRYWSVVLLTGIVITFAVEIFLFLLLNSGAPMRNLRHCKHWFCLRILLFLFSIAGLVIDLTLLGDYSLITGLLQLEKLYRIATLFVMWKFMDEVKAGYFDNAKLNSNIVATDVGGSSNMFGSKNSPIPEQIPDIVMEELQI